MLNSVRLSKLPVSCVAIQDRLNVRNQVVRKQEEASSSVNVNSLSDLLVIGPVVRLTQKIIKIIQWKITLHYSNNSLKPVSTSVTCVRSGTPRCCLTSLLKRKASISST